MSENKTLTIACCLPGETYSSAWVSNWTALFGWMLTHGINVQLYFAYSSNVFATRGRILETVLETDHPRPDYLLWVDDDNIITSATFSTLLDALEHRDPDAAMAAAWCWIQPDAYDIQPIVSCGMLSMDGKCLPLALEDMAAAAESHRLLDVDYTGFPIVLMRTDLVDLIRIREHHPFAPILSNAHAYGCSGEDYAFCVRAGRAGQRIVLVPELKVPHLKLRDASPGMPAAGKAMAAGQAGLVVVS